ncbi:hypothetical protein N180_06285 [Pedobacter antarcticus 4BY]|uniref:ComEC/Rec2-related protein domain-containing protein n=3 Tax=Pedobacter antarcticus TaxID=34086 RepID=A0A081PHG3_9SPHI|nr:ComEC/Rec2 family competence protein [Pedobacter antarcticus]KEQ30136.1 hypothetical protein N180_06285 [Pedobacter antarcticus 4BY]
MDTPVSIPFFARIIPQFLVGIYISQHSIFTKLNLPEDYLVIYYIFTLIIINLLHTSTKIKHYMNGSLFVIGLLVLMHGFILGRINDELTNSEHFSKKNPDFLLLEILTEPVLSFGQIQFTAMVKSIEKEGRRTKASGRILIKIKPIKMRLSDLSFGQLLWAPGNYELTAGPLNPGMFDYKKWLARKKVHHQYLIEEKDVLLLNQRAGNKLLSHAVEWRKKQVDLYRKLLVKKDAVDVASTLILGYRAELDRALVSAYSRTGTIHVLSVSGMHVGIIYIVLDWLLLHLNTTRTGRHLKLFILLSLIWFYTILTGYAASVIRAAVMLSIFLISKTLGRTSAYQNLIFLAAFGMLHYNPYWLWDIGFQLSFLAVAGIIYLYPLICNALNWQTPPSKKLGELVSLSIAAQLFTTPLSIYYFHLFPMSFIISNIFITIPVTLIMYSGILVIILKSQYLAIFLEWQITLLNEGLIQINNLPYPVIERLWPTEFQVAILYLLLILLLIPGSAKNRLFGIATLMILLQITIVCRKVSIRQQSQMMHFNTPYPSTLAYIQANRAYIITNLNQSDPTFAYYIQPALDSMGIKKVFIFPK